MTVSIIGGGLAGTEAAWALAERGFEVVLHEMRPNVQTPAHQTSGLAELVCTNSFKSTEVVNAHGLLKAELKALGSLLLNIAEDVRVPGGAALAVDRTAFSEHVTRRIEAHPNIRVARGEITDLRTPAIVATGPLTSPTLADAIAKRLGIEHLAFFDAIAPIVEGDSVDETILYRKSRYGKGDGDDYLNAPMTKEQYLVLVEGLRTADLYDGHDFDKVPYFEGCLPVEVMAGRGEDVLRFGPLKPVGLEHPVTGERPYAVLQLRAEDVAGQMWNLVGFQTRMKIPSQREVLSKVPGLANAEFLRFGSIHRNTYLNSPAVLTRFLNPKDDDRLFFAGQLTGVEGYTESLGTGLLCGLNMARVLSGRKAVIPPRDTMLGSLMAYLAEADPRRFQPMNANFGLLPPLTEHVRDKRKKRELLAYRALTSMKHFADGILGAVPV